MANGFGSMFIGVAGLQSSQNALNVTSNNLANLDTTGYVRQSVLFADRDYVTFNTTAAISNQQSGLGVTIGDVVHSRDVFLDRLYRTESSRQSFYASTSEALTEVQNYYQELEGRGFQTALHRFLGNSFQELHNFTRSDGVDQNLVIQKAQLLPSRSSAAFILDWKSCQYS
ncbi:MAG: flagellar basal body protein [Roseburia intestinalis]